MKMQKIGINCPEVVMLKKNILLMSFIGDNNIAAPKLKNATLTAAELILAYEEIVDMMVRLYNEANLVHADLSEYNILWHDGKCWLIDVAQAVEPSHPGALVSHFFAFSSTKTILFTFGVDINSISFSFSIHSGIFVQRLRQHFNVFHT